MVELETSTLGASPTLFIDEGASILVPLPHDALHRSRHVPRPRRRIGLFEALPWLLGVRKPFRLEPLELLGDGGLDGGRQVFLHERLETLELVAGLRIRRERDLVARRCKGLNDWRSRWRRCRPAIRPAESAERAPFWVERLLGPDRVRAERYRRAPGACAPSTAHPAWVPAPQPAPRFRVWTCEPRERGPLRNWRR